MELLEKARKLLDEMRETTALAEQCQAKMEDPRVPEVEKERAFQKEFNFLIDSASIYEDILDITRKMGDNLEARRIEREARRMLRTGMVDVG